ncbi:MAG: hydroxyacylglutathione hydrolase [Magnetospirillum sp.]|nr:hydroxyacylglutathione hydrolase [Magnetospirillum sp.]
MLTVERIPCLQDNYVWLLRSSGGNGVGVVDPAEAAPVEAVLARHGLALTHIFNTHHHGDHVGANLALKAKYGPTIVGPRADQARIPGIDLALADGESYAFDGEIATVLDVPGHTRGHIAFWFAGSAALFCGDTLFALGCGRMFEGTAPQMWMSLAKIRALPDATQVYCAHEYTQSNAKFAVSVDPDNAELRARSATIDRQRLAGEATVPSLLGLEKRTNPFLRADDAGLARRMGLPATQPAAVFGALRAAKDVFR